MKNCLYSHLYLEVKKDLHQKNPPHLLNLLMEKPGN